MQTPLLVCLLFVEVANACSQPLSSWQFFRGLATDLQQLCNHLMMHIFPTTYFGRFHLFPHLHFFQKFVISTCSLSCEGFANYVHLAFSSFISE